MFLWMKKLDRMLDKREERTLTVHNIWQLLKEMFSV